MAQALLNRPVRMPRRRTPHEPWNLNPGRHAWIILEEPGMPDYEPRFLLEDDTGGENHILLLENA